VTTRTAIALFYTVAGLCCTGGSAVERSPAERSEIDAQTSERVVFIQMADPQLGFARTPVAVQLAGGSWGDEPTELEIARFESAVEYTNQLRPDFVVICGDLVNRPGHAEQIAEFQRIAAGFDPTTPLYLVAGNHDVGGAPTRESLRAYRDTFGADWYSFQHDALFAIVLNSSLIKDPSQARDEAAAQLAWLRTELERAESLGASDVLVFQHHSFFVSEPDEPDDYFNIPLAHRREILTILKKAGVRAVFAGHFHQNAIARDGELEMITTSAVGTPLGEDPPGFRIVRWVNGQIEHKFFAIEEPGLAHPGPTPMEKRP
jgi:3',5'-cyclic AMP phosphodiesterase CpdA